MAIVNRRNAVVGWLAVKVGKRVAKKKAQRVVPRARTGGGAAAGKLTAFGGLLLGTIVLIFGKAFFWRRKRSGGDD